VHARNAFRVGRMQCTTSSFTRPIPYVVWPFEFVRVSQYELRTRAPTRSKKAKKKLCCSGRRRLRDRCVRKNISPTSASCSRSWWNQSRWTKSIGWGRALTKRNIFVLVGFPKRCDRYEKKNYISKQWRHRRRAR
jgi:hypothetical protein